MQSSPGSSGELSSLNDAETVCYSYNEDLNDVLPKALINENPWYVITLIFYLGNIAVTNGLTMSLLVMQAECYGGFGANRLFYCS